MKKSLWILVILCSSMLYAGEQSVSEKPCFSGIYPQNAYFNREGECGTGAVVPWAGKLWWITYGPHCPWGSSDKLYELDPNGKRTIRPESIGGTPANRMIHSESQQLFLGSYVIDKNGGIRVLSYKNMPGRLTGNARHLTDPANKIYFATMEEGVYEVDVHSLAVKTLYPDSNRKPNGYVDILPGYHGKGAYSAQGRLIYANNGERSDQARRLPETTSGCLGSWNGKDWTVVRRNQFTEVTGPGGIYGNKNPNDLLWSIGWDYRSVMLMVLDGDQWTLYRIPKASHCYDGAHGWNTEWPRIREISSGLTSTASVPGWKKVVTPEDYLMTMHGMFWKFPNTFSTKSAKGIRPRSTYLKVIGDFCSWNGRMVAGCDDTAKSEFLNKSPFKGKLAEPGQSNSNLWFFDPALLDKLGTPIGRGAVWFNDKVTANSPSDPYLFAGYQNRCLFIQSKEPAVFTLEVDLNGDGNWVSMPSVSMQTATSRAIIEFTEQEQGEWIRVKADRDLSDVTAMFFYQNADHRSTVSAEKFNGLADVDATDYLGGLLWMRNDNQRLAVVAQCVTDGMVSYEGYYELTEDAKLVPGDAANVAVVKEKVAIDPLSEKVYRVDQASVICGFEGKEYRLPFGCEKLVRTEGALPLRLDREVATERDLFHCAGTFYEMPAMNAGGLPKIRPVATDGKRITDYASYRGMMVLTGLDQTTKSDHIVRSVDGKAAVWCGCIEDLWEIGKAVGHGCTWKKENVKANVPSLPFLMTGFDRKSLKLVNHDVSTPVSVTVEVDIAGMGVWLPYTVQNVAPGQTVNFTFPAAMNAYWVRTVSSHDAVLTAEFRYQ